MLLFGAPLPCPLRKQKGELGCVCSPAFVQHTALAASHSYHLRQKRQHCVAFKVATFITSSVDSRKIPERSFQEAPGTRFNPQMDLNCLYSFLSPKGSRLPAEV